MICYRITIELDEPIPTIKTEHGIERSEHSSEITRLLDGGSLAI